jgi:hypothetical protein
MKRILFLTILFALFLIPCLAQEKEAQKFLEYGEMFYGEASANMDALAANLKNEPNLEAYIVVYSGKNDYLNVSHRYAERLKVYLITRGIEANRIVAIGAGQIEKQKTEIWLVPKGAKPPALTEPFNF